jgi:hypothetical protein
MLQQLQTEQLVIQALTEMFANHGHEQFIIDGGEANPGPLHELRLEATIRNAYRRSTKNWVQWCEEDLIYNAVRKNREKERKAMRDGKKAFVVSGGEENPGPAPGAKYEPEDCPYNCGAVPKAKIVGKDGMCKCPECLCDLSGADGKYAFFAIKRQHFIDHPVVGQTSAKLPETTGISVNSRPVEGGSRTDAVEDDCFHEKETVATMPYEEVEVAKESKLEALRASLRELVPDSQQSPIPPEPQESRSAPPGSQPVEPPKEETDKERSARIQRIPLDGYRLSGVRNGATPDVFQFAKSQGFSNVKQCFKLLSVEDDKRLVTHRAVQMTLQDVVLGQIVMRKSPCGFFLKFIFLVTASSFMVYTTTAGINQAKGVCLNNAIRSQGEYYFEPQFFTPWQRLSGYQFNFRSLIDWNKPIVVDPRDGKFEEFAQGSWKAFPSFLYHSIPRWNPLKDQTVCRNLIAYSLLYQLAFAAPTVLLMIATVHCVKMRDFNERKLLYCPHMVTAVLEEVRKNDTIEIVDAKVRPCLLRLATVAIPDVLNYDVIVGCEEMIKFIVRQDSFFGPAGALPECLPDAPKSVL